MISAGNGGWPHSRIVTVPPLRIHQVKVVVIDQHRLLRTIKHQLALWVRVRLPDQPWRAGHHDKKNPRERWILRLKLFGLLVLGLIAHPTIDQAHLVFLRPRADPATEGTRKALQLLLIERLRTG